MGVNNVSGTNQDLLCMDTSMLFAISSPWGPFFLAALTRQLKDKLKEMDFISQIFFWRETGRTIWWEGDNTAIDAFLCDMGRNQIFGKIIQIWLAKAWQIFVWLFVRYRLGVSEWDCKGTTFGAFAKANALTTKHKVNLKLYRTLCLEHALWGFAIVLRAGQGVQQKAKFIFVTRRLKSSWDTLLGSTIWFRLGVRAVGSGTKGGHSNRIPQNDAK